MGNVLADDRRCETEIQTRIILAKEEFQMLSKALGNEKWNKEKSQAMKEINKEKIV